MISPDTYDLLTIEQKLLNRGFQSDVHPEVGSDFYHTICYVPQASFGMENPMFIL